LKVVAVSPQLRLFWSGYHALVQSEKLRALLWREFMCFLKAFCFHVLMKIPDADFFPASGRASVRICKFG